MWLTKEDIRKINLVGADIKENCYIADSVYIDNHGKVIVGDKCVLTSGVMILSHDASRAIEGLPIDNFKTTILGNNVFVGIRSIILSGRTIGNNVIIGAGSVVTKDVPDNQIWAGNPAKFIRNIKKL